MIRFVWISSLLTILVLVLYLPSAIPPARFMEVMDAEQRLNEDVWGRERAQRIRARMLDLQSGTVKVSTAPAGTQRAAGIAGQASGIHSVAANEFARMSVRLFDNPYFQAMDTLLMLATYRVAMLLEVMPFVLVFAAACVLDGLVMRTVRSKEFLLHSPEVFALAACSAIGLLCSVLVATVVPEPLHPLHISAAMLLAAFVGSLSIANFHRRG